MAEGVGFEPTIRYNRIPDFESGAFDLSATLPRRENWNYTEVLRKKQAPDPESAFRAVRA